ncbi:Uu.00g101950.m01.CDS01 [Anthostomella pinea]|uniref:Cytochrome P450 monooxygenase ABA1 n=1 Tax=Anthostomella pinea TaxID=933095 RepID=A0AAI8YFG3_9PEZI|nr:Uu.00g101950.m01.CDS01 [Anthostomella pinea]
MAPQLQAVLSSSYLVPMIGCLFFITFILSYISSWRRLRHIDGPLLASISYLWMFRTSLTGEQAARYGTISQKYGRLARIGPNDLLTSDPEVLRRMNGARSKYGRSSWYRAMRMDPYADSLFTQMDAGAHDRLKAQLAFGYGGRENPTIERGIDEQVANLVALVRRKYLSTGGEGTTGPRLRPMDLATVVNYFTLDAITRVAYGRAFGYLETDSDVFSYIEASEAQVPIMVLLADVPYLARIAYSDTVLKLFGPKTTDKKGMGQMLAVAQKVVGERFGPEAKDRQDMMGSFVRHGVPRRQCEAEVIFQIIAGSDTTATAIRGTMLHLMSMPSAYLRLREEVDAAAAAGRISSPIQVDEARQLEYLQAVILEGLRMNPPFSGLIMKEVPRGGDTIDGKFVPEGTRVGQSILAIMRSPTIFGQDADVFRPERWLGGIESEDNTRHREMAQAVDLLFGHGRWGCSGKAVAFMELNKVYVELLRNFDFQLIDVRKPVESKNYNIFFQKNMWVKVTERTKS